MDPCECEQADIDAGCCNCGGVSTDLPGTEHAANPVPIGLMTACRAGPLIQKVIG